MTDEERIRYLEESIRELRKEKENLKKEKGKLKEWLVQENKLLKEENKSLKNELMEDMKTETKLNEENRNLKSELSKFRDSFKKYRDYEKEELAESCYDLVRENEKLKEEVARLEFDIEAWKKLKSVREDKERILNEEIRGLRDKKYSYWEPVVSSWPCFARWNSN